MVVGRIPYCYHMCRAIALANERTIALDLARTQDLCDHHLFEPCGRACRILARVRAQVRLQAGARILGGKYRAEQAQLQT